MYVYRSITPTRYRKMNGLSGNGSKDDIDINHKKGKYPFVDFQCK